MIPVSTDSSNNENISANSLAQVQKRWLDMLPGSGVFLMLVLLNWRIMSSSEMMISPGWLSEALCTRM